jgi:hypothetical protein
MELLALPTVIVQLTLAMAVFVRCVIHLMSTYNVEMQLVLQILTVLQTLV